MEGKTAGRHNWVEGITAGGQPLTKEKALCSNYCSRPTSSCQNSTWLRSPQSWFPRPVWERCLHSPTPASQGHAHNRHHPSHPTPSAHNNAVALEAVKPSTSCLKFPGELLEWTTPGHLQCILLPVCVRCWATTLFSPSSPAPSLPLSPPSRSTAVYARVRVHVSVCVCARALWWD